MKWAGRKGWASAKALRQRLVVRGPEGAGDGRRRGALVGAQTPSWEDRQRLRPVCLGISPSGGGAVRLRTPPGPWPEAASWGDAGTGVQGEAGWQTLAVLVCVSPRVLPRIYTGTTQLQRRG